MIISSGPLQGLTDAIYRKTHHEVWGGIDEYYGPYLLLDAHKEPKASQIRDIESPLNKTLKYIPQLMGNDPLLLIERLHWLKDLGFHHVNWNLGCPYPMVSKRNMGAGLLNQPEHIRKILEEIIPQSPLEHSIKCRLGLNDEQEIFPLIGVFNQFKLKEIIIHTRTASQMYKGKAKPESMPEIIEQSVNPIAYNGDIHSLEKHHEIQRFSAGKISHIMLGRGLLMKPYLAQQIKGNMPSNEEIKKGMLEFHDRLIEQYGAKLQGHQLVMKMRTFWEYFSQSFSNPHKTFKLIKKSGNMRKYNNAVDYIFKNYGDFENYT